MNQQVSSAEQRRKIIDLLEDANKLAEKIGDWRTVALIESALSEARP